MPLRERSYRPPDAVVRARFSSTPGCAQYNTSSFEHSRGFEMMVLGKIFEFAPDAIVMTNREGRIVRVSTQAEKLFGYEQDELLGQVVEVLVPDHLRSVHGSRRGSEPARHYVRPFGTELELYARRKDGTEFPADIMMNYLETDEGWLAVAIIRDLTDRKLAEEK